MHRHHTSIRTLALWSLYLTMSLATACSNAEGAAATDTLSEEKVVETYNHYIREEFPVYVDQMASLDDKSEDYRNQMANLMKQRYVQQKEEHGGPVSCRVIRLKHNPGKTYCEAYIEVTFQDRSFHEILIPFVKKNGEWRMR